MAVNQLTIRPPVVVVLGHVDHGKSSLLEAIKDFKITQKEAGGITQHIGAYEIEHQGKKITFIDTPGHEAFSTIRTRGAKVADIAVLVVAADEGVKPQTKEAINCAKLAGIPIIVAINKIDKPNADPERVKKELAKEGVLVEGLGGEVPVVETSATQKKGISDLLEMILLVAEMEELKCDLKKGARGTVIEAYLDPKRGPIATLILKEGTLKLQNIIATPSSLAKIKSMEDFQGNSIKEALPSQPVVVLGFLDVPRVGEEFKSFLDIERAREYAIKKEKEPASRVVFIEPSKKVLNLVIKADVLGSLEAIEKVISSLPQDQVVLRILRAEVGNVGEGDIKLAEAGAAKILAFRVKTDPLALRAARQKKIDILRYEIIYELAQGVRKLITRTVEPEIVKKDLGKVKVLVVFKTEKTRQIIGGKVVEGEIEKGLNIEIFREEEKIGEGKIVNLQIEKKDIQRAKTGQEIGILYEGEAKIKVGDILNVYTKEKKTILQ
jgi:translation initiation factor IF-2